MPDMRVNGVSIKRFVKEKEDKFGQMDPCMKDGGWIIKPMEKEDLFMPMVMYMMVNGLMIKLMDSVSIAILMEPSMRATGKKISNMEMDLRPGQMVQDMKVNMFKEKNMAKVNSLGLMAALTTDNS
jgi:hypothetical protein